MALINKVRIADALDTDGVTVTAVVWEAEDSVTGQILTFYFDVGTSDADAQSQMSDADTAEKPPPDPITAKEPKWQYNSVTKEYCVFGDDGLKLFALKRDAAGNAVITLSDAAGKPVEPAWLDLTRSGGANQGSIVTGTDIIMDFSRGSGITYDTATGVVSLKAGKTYRLFATFAIFSIQSSDTVAIEWVKASDNVKLEANHETRLRPANAASNGSNASTIEIIWKVPGAEGDADVGVKLRCTEYTGSPDAITMYGERSMATVVRL